MISAPVIISSSALACSSLIANNPSSHLREKERVEIITSVPVIISCSALAYSSLIAKNPSSHLTEGEGEGGENDIRSCRDIQLRSGLQLTTCQ